MFSADAGYRITHGRQVVPAREYRKDRHPRAGATADVNNEE
jgi:hypothetical protein